MRQRIRATHMRSIAASLDPGHREPGSIVRVVNDSPAVLGIVQLGVVEYGAALDLQACIREARQAEEVPDLLLLLEHPPVYTRGRRSEPGELPMGEAWYLSQGIDVVDTDRGGRVTYHGPGQLVGYPIMRIDDVVAYLRTMERAIVATLADCGLDAGPRDKLTGVWVQDRKIGSIGVHVSRGVTTHGFAINVENDLQPFEWIVPCGLEGVRMTSVSRESDAPGPGLLPGFRETVAKCFAQAFARQARTMAPEELPLAGVRLA
jgi:lipoyl(octanoyl) transferase